MLRHSLSFVAVLAWAALSVGACQAKPNGAGGRRDGVHESDGDEAQQPGAPTGKETVAPTGNAGSVGVSGGGLGGTGGGGSSASAGDGEAGGPGAADGGGSFGSGGNVGTEQVEFGLDARPMNTTCVAFERPSGTLSVSLVNAFPALDFGQIIAAVQAPDSGEEWHIVEQPGRVYAFANDMAASSSRLVLNITDRVKAGGERGLLGIAFHPNYAQNGYVFLTYTHQPQQGKLRLRLSRFVRAGAAGGAVFDPASEQIVLEIEKKRDIHQAGTLAFGGDGYLYLSVGDGGSGLDIDGNAQNTHALLGKVLRIDVDHPAAGKHYGIPPGNPFADGVAGAPEVYAWGFRNPWKWSFDRSTGRLWLGDVGESQLEEVNIVDKGRNYGWPFFEGGSCLFGNPGCSRTDLVSPVVQYQHAEGQAVTGGYVYRGNTISALVGSYVYGDYVSGRIWRLRQDAETGQYLPDVLIENTGMSISSFAQGNDGELYILEYGGKILRLQKSAGIAGAAPPRRLSETGCVDSADPTKPAAGLIPYSINVPFWSDGAEKERYLALPEGGTISVDEQGRWLLPPGSVLMKQFRIGGELVETRLFMRHSDGIWGGYSYEWNDAGTDAELLAADKRATHNGVNWHFPSRGECLQCHNRAAGRVLGLRTVQFAKEHVYPGNKRANQLKTLAHIGVFAQPLPVGFLDTAGLPDLTDAAIPVAERARAYLDANCANCHRPEGPGRGELDFRIGVLLEATGACDRAPKLGSLGIDDARVVAPGHAHRSVLLERIRRTDSFRMPPVSSRIPDPAGTSIIEQWISGLTACH